MTQSRKRNPYAVIRSRHVTEKAMTLAGLEESESNPCTRACKTPKAVFLVDPSANKREIAQAVEEIYKEQKVKVVKVNTTRNKPKQRRVRGKIGYKSGFKKAVVSFEPGDRLDNV